MIKKLWLVLIPLVLLISLLSFADSIDPIPLPDSDLLSRNGLTTYTDNDFSWSMMYSSDWILDIPVVNDPSKPDRVMLKSIELTSPNFETIYIDVWENTDGKGLLNRFNKYHLPFLSANAPEVTGPNGTVGGVPAILVTDSSAAGEINKGSYYPSKVAFFAHGQYIFRIEYTASALGVDESGMQTVLESFTFLSGLAVSDLSNLTAFSSETMNRVQGDISAPSVNQCGSLSSPGNPYPCCNNRDGGRGNCTWYAWYKRPDLGQRNFGNAKDWLARAKQAGFPTGRTPKAGAIGVYTTGKYGHVAYVEKVRSDGRIVISQMNCFTPPAYTPSQVINSYFHGFIYPKSNPIITPTPTPTPTATPTSTVPPTPTVTPTQTIGPNLLQNWGFEQSGAPAVISPWNFTQTSSIFDCAWTTTYGGALEGTKMLSTNRSVDDGRCLSLYQDQYVYPKQGEVYTLRAYVRRGWDGTTRKGRLAIWALGGVQETANIAFEVGGSWTCVSTKLRINNVNHTAIRSELYFDSIGHPDFQLDKFMLVRGDVNICP